MIWILSGVESLTRTLSIYCFGSSDHFIKMGIGMGLPGFIFLILLLELSIFGLWLLYFNKLYLWREIMTEQKIRNDINFVEGKSRSANFETA